MKRIISLTLFICLLIISGCSQNVDVDIDAAKKQVQIVLDNLIKSSEMKDMELTSEIYAHDPDMVIIGTDSSERIIGWDNLKEVLEKQFAGTESSKLTVKDQVIKVNKSGTAAWFSEVIDWDITFSGEASTIEGLRTTGVLENRNGSWVIVQLHYSIPN